MDISKKVVFNSITNMEELIEIIELRLPSLDDSELEKYKNSKKLLFQLKKIYLKNR